METNFETAAPTTEAANDLDLAAELSAAKAKAEDNYNKFLYAMADFENYKKRIERQFAEIATAGKRSTLEKFLPVMDNLERALAFDASGDALRNGLTGTLRGFEAVLAAEGVKAYSVKGEAFDPKIAEAIGTQESSDFADDVVLEEAVRGYKIGDDVLRPAQVIVAKSASTDIRA